MEIRDAVDSDWAAVWGFLQPIVAAGDTYCWPPDTSAVVGTAVLHPNQPAAGSHVANAGFMVSPNAASRGIGRALARRILEVAAEDGYAAMQFNAVVETNEHAVRLWESLGFTILATIPEAFRHPDRGFVGLHIMHRFLR